jgi:hypothetical protein
VRNSGAPVAHDGALALREYDIGFEVSVSNGVYEVNIDTSFKNLNHVKSCAPLDTSTLQSLITIKKNSIYFLSNG